MFNYASTTPTLVPSSATGPMNGTGRLAEFGNVGGYATLTPSTIAPNGQPLYLSPFCGTASCIPQVTPFQNIAPMWNSPVAPVQPGYPTAINPFVQPVVAPSIGWNTLPFVNANPYVTNPVVNNPFVANPVVNPFMTSPFGIYGTPYANIPTPFVNPISGLPVAGTAPFVNPLTVNPLSIAATTPFVNPALTGMAPSGISPFAASMFGTLPFSPIGLNGFAGTLGVSPFVNPAMTSALSGLNPLAITSTLPFGISPQVPFSPINPLASMINPWIASSTLPFGVNPLSTLGLGATIPTPFTNPAAIGVNPLSAIAPTAFGANPWLSSIANPIFGHGHVPGINPIAGLFGAMTGLNNPLAHLGINSVNPFVNPLAMTPWSTFPTPYGISPMASIYGTGIESIVPGLNRLGGLGYSSVFGGVGLPSIPGVVPGMINTPYAGIGGVNPLLNACCGVC
jgi:hypothetical protein